MTIQINILQKLKFIADISIYYQAKIGKRSQVLMLFRRETQRNEHWEYH